MRSLRAVTSLARSPPITVVPAHSGSARVEEGTYFGNAFSFEATGSSGSVTLGQYAAKMSYVRRPRRKAPGRPKTSLMNWPKSSSANGKLQPPCSKPPRVSSSGPPGAW